MNGTSGSCRNLFYLVSIILFIPTFTVLANIPKRLPAIRISEAPKINGRLDEICWQNLQPARDFIIHKPNFGNPASFNTEVKIGYDDEAIYVGARLFDPEPEKIIQWLAARDNLDETDVFGIGFDTYDDNQNAFVFLTNPAGVQQDERISGNNSDKNWDAVWQVQTGIRSDGWVVEMKIPFSALRFSNNEIQNWGLGFYRNIARLNESSFWTPVDPNKEGLVWQFGEWNGLTHLKPPMRLVLLPYINTGWQRTPDADEAGNFDNKLLLNGGLDLKYGLSDGFTLDATLIPDFGQVQSDNLVLNTGPFEVIFDERRPFFTEGTDIFNSGNGKFNDGNIFYSRRIGAPPLLRNDLYDMMEDEEEIIENPSVTSLLNACKVSGRTGHRLGIGVLNAISAPTYATLHNTSTDSIREVLTNPLTNYNVIALDQSLKNNSRIGFLNTNVMRDGRFYDANVSSITFDFRDKKNTYSTFGSLYGSYVGNEENGTDIGYRYNVGHSKISGKWRYDFAHTFINKNYDQNDMGFLFRNNEMSNFAGIIYTENKPNGWRNNWNTSLGISLSHRLDPFEYQELNVNFSIGAETKKFHGFGMFINAKPIAYNDFYESRTPGRKYIRVPVGFISSWFYTNPNKKAFIEISMNFAESPIPRDPYYEINLKPVLKIGDKAELSYSLNYNHDFRSFVFVDRGQNDTIILAARQLMGWSHQVTAKYYISPVMNIILNGRHYWSQFKVDDFVNLDKGGHIAHTAWSGIYDQNFDAFNIDLVYSWQFSPGSMLNIIWKNAIFYNDNIAANHYAQNLGQTFKAPQSNSISLKFIYYLDALKLRSWVQRIISHN